MKSARWTPLWEIMPVPHPWAEMGAKMAVFNQENQGSNPASAAS